MTTLNVLKNSPRREEARKFLESVLKAVQPIILKYKLSVPLVSEFYPQTPNLLGININRGQHIKVRLRHHARPLEFLAWEGVVVTMLHELVHNIHSNHSSEFYAQLERWRSELEDIMNGLVVPAPAFSGSGIRLGGSGSGNAINRSAILSAAERRRNGANEPRKLGGNGMMSGDARRSAVEAALKRRKEHDDKICRHPISATGSLVDGNEDNDEVIAWTIDRLSDGTEVVVIL